VTFFSNAHPARSADPATPRGTQRIHAFFIDDTRPSTSPEGVDVREDDTRQQTQPEHLEPIDAYHRALLACSAELNALTRTMVEGDAERFSSGAGEAVAMWIAADAARKRLAPVLAEAPELLDASRSGLTERYCALVRLFDLASTRFTAPSLRDQLSGLRKSLEIARW
jgi:hypothetical protein